MVFQDVNLREFILRSDLHDIKPMLPSITMLISYYPKLILKSSNDFNIITMKGIHWEKYFSHESVCKQIKTHEHFLKHICVTKIICTLIKVCVHYKNHVNIPYNMCSILRMQTSFREHMHAFRNSCVFLENLSWHACMVS